MNSMLCRVSRIAHVSTRYTTITGIGTSCGGRVYARLLAMAPVACSDDVSLDLGIGHISRDALGQNAFEKSPYRHARNLPRVTTVAAEITIQSAIRMVDRTRSEA